MHASSIHELYEDIEKEPERMVEKAKSLGCKYIACGLSRFTVWEDENSLKELTDGLNRLGKYFKEQGLELLYHNHNMEFAKYDGKHTALEYILREYRPGGGRSRAGCLLGTLKWFYTGGLVSEAW